MNLLIMLTLVAQCMHGLVADHPADTLTWAARQFKQDALVIVNLPGVGTNEKVCTQMYQGGQVMAEHCWVPETTLEADEWPDWDLSKYTIIVINDQRMPDGTLWTKIARPIAPAGYDPPTDEQGETHECKSVAPMFER